MVLVDTSIWIRFLAGREPFARGLDHLLERGDVVAHELVYVELLIGDSHGHRRAMLADYAQRRWAPTLPHDEVVGFVTTRKLAGRGVGWVDVHLIASALASSLRFWTADVRTSRLAAELGLVYPG